MFPAVETVSRSTRRMSRISAEFSLSSFAILAIDSSSSLYLARMEAASLAHPSMSALVIAADTSKWGDVTWESMQAPTSSDTDVATVGSVANSTYGISTVTGTPAFKLTPIAEGECTVTVDAVADGQDFRLVFDVIGVDAE